VLPIWPFQSATPVARDLSIAERIAKVAIVKVAPSKLVGYVGDSVTFVAMGTDAFGQPAHGAKFTWESSDPNKLTIDEAGRASLLHPGLIRVTARAGFAGQTALVLIRPTRRPLQTDEEWRADQDSLVGSTGDESSDKSVLAALVDRVAPTAYAQGGGQGADYGNAASVGQVGTPPFTALEDTRLGPVMPQSNFELPIPLVNLGGRGLATSLMAYYNSNVWGSYFDPIRNGTVYVFDPIQGWPCPGFSLGFGRIVYYNFDGTNYTYMLIDPNGTRHSLGNGPALTNSTLHTTDGSHITFVGNAVNGGTLYSNDGTQVTIGKVNNRLLPTQITDTNGNYIQVAYVSNTSFPGIAINYIVDTLGRVIQFNYGQWPAPTSTSLSSISTPTGAITFNYQNVTMNYSFLSAAAVENAPATFYAVSGLTIPQRPTYSFSYSGYGMIYSASAASAGGTATVTYNYPLGGEDLYGGPTFTQRTESPNAVYSYTWTDVTRPDGTKLILSGPDRELRSTSNTTLAKTVSTMTTDPGGSQALQSLIAYDDIGQQTKVDFDYDQYGNVVNKREYGYQISGAWQVRRRTHYNYVNWEPYLSAYMRNRLTEVDLFDAQQNTNDADDVLIGKTVYAFDNYSGMGGMENYAGLASPPGHLSSYGTSQTARGNLTDATTYSDVGAGTSVTHRSKLDIFGGVTKAQLDCCNQKSFTMTEGTYWSRSSQTTSGDTSGIYLTSSASYDFNTLVATSQTNPDNQTTTYSYDAQQNPTGFNSPTGASGSTSYNAFGERTSSTVTYNDGGVNKSITSSAVYDGWGQMTSSVDANGAQTNFAYDNMGHRLTQTNPFPQGGTPGPVTSYQYDQLGRVTQVTLPGGNTIQTSYSGSVVTVTDQVNRKIKRESDGLGRLIKVTEQDVSTGGLTQETTYTYDLSDRLTGVTQGSQTRAFKYDSQGHLLFERIPEIPAMVNDGTGTMWSTKYTYTSFGAVATKTDGRGVIITYGYDNLNRLTSISYNTSGAPNVASTPSVTYIYDNNQSSSTKGLLLSLNAGSGYSESYGYDSFNRMASLTRTIDGRNYTSSYQYNTANQVTQMTYPSGRVINLGRDSKGRVASVGSYLTSVTYNGIGQLTGTSLGNSVSESYTYDANRMQLSTQTATKSGGPTGGLMNLTYSYQASAGQMGAGSTAGNAGQLIAINNNSTINGTSESAAYTYDNLGRLVTSNQTSNGASAGRRFAYDRWGNRTGMWDAVSGGNLLQNIVIDGANHIWSVNAGNSNPNYYYDPAGNLVWAEGHSYTYDAENRLVSVDGGATGQYSYDPSNRRYKKVTGGVTTHYIWQRSQVIAEYDGSGGTVTAEYVYSGSRMIAKIASGTSQYFLGDRLSTKLVLDTSGNVLGRQGHLPYGEDFGESGSQENHHFTSYERDAESSTDYALNRRYSQSLGRFMQYDPIAGSIDNPQSLNRYTYTNNEPIDQIDPSGRSPYYCPAWIHNCNAYLGAPGFTGSVSIAPIGGGEGSTVPILNFGPYPKKVKKSFDFKFPCKKSATDAVDELKQRFTELASYQASDGSYIEFEKVPIRLAAFIAIHTSISTFWLPDGTVPLGPVEFHVQVIFSSPNAFTFGTQDDHAFYPGTIKFRIDDAKNGEVAFSIDLEGETNGFGGTIGYYMGGGAFEDKVWFNLGEQVKTEICGNMKQN
jgi:RHS repeat-associated protein